MSISISDIISYLETRAFSVIVREPEFIVADKLDFGDRRQTMLVWAPSIPEEEETYPNLERRLSADFQRHRDSYPDATRWLVADSFSGFSKSFRQTAASLGVALRVPIQFFDSPFKVDTVSSATSTTIAELRKPVHRIPQPYSTIIAGEVSDQGVDLLETLKGDIQAAERASLYIVVGPAGVGKTWFFRTLFAEMYANFLDKKNRLEQFPRPIPFTPEYARRRGIYLRTQELIREFIEAELSSLTPLPTFEWMLTRNYALWLFDGLDELYSGDPSYFDTLADLLTRPPSSKSKILVCARESLLTSSPSFADFLRDFPPGISNEPRIALYRLDRWDTPSKKAFASLHLDDSTREGRFLAYIGRSDSLKALSSLPYYCNLLMEEFKLGGTTDFADDFDLINHSISEMVKREESKGLLSPSSLNPGGLDEWLETVALEFFTSSQKGISIPEVKTYANAVLVSDLTDEERENAVTTLLQFPLLGRAAEPDMLAFEHELIAEFLVARYLARRLLTHPERVATQLSTRRDFGDSLIARYMARSLPSQPASIEGLAGILKEAALPGRNFTVLLQLLLMATPQADLIKKFGISLEGRDLGQVKFLAQDLSEVSFRTSDLTDTTFDSCNLRRARFQGAILRGTRFAVSKRLRLESAEFGNLDRFEHVYVGRTRYDDRAEFAEWLTKTVGAPTSPEEPCPSAQQLRVIFTKFVNPDGSGRRDEMAAVIMSKGKQIRNAPSPDAMLDAAVKHGYILRIAWHDRVKRVPGKLYDDMVDYVKQWKLSSHMRTLLDKMCDIPNCPHVPKAYNP